MDLPSYLLGRNAGGGGGGGEKIQYTTMPTPSASYVGKVVQYVGETDSTYTSGYFYTGVTDGQATPTYSWENINVQSTGVEYYVISLTQYADSITLTPEMLAVFQSMYDEYLQNKPYTKQVVIHYDYAGGITGYNVNIPLIVSNIGRVGNTVTFVAENLNHDIQTNNLPTVYQSFITFNVENETLTTIVSQNTKQAYLLPKVGDGAVRYDAATTNLSTAAQVLTVGNTKAFTPSADYHPATKKYVDDSIDDTLLTIEARLSQLASLEISNIAVVQELPQSQEEGTLYLVQE